MNKFRISLLVTIFVCFLGDLYGLSLFSKRVFPKEFTKAVEKHLGEDYGGKDVAVFREMIRNFKYNDSVFTQSQEQELQASMKKYAGNNFLAEYQYLLKEKTNDSNKKLARSMINLIKQQFIKLKEVEAQYVTPNLDQFNQISEMRTEISELNADTPCNTEGECKQLENMMNICTYIREGADFAYDIFSVTTHIVTTMMTVMCACIFIGPVHVCALKNFPYTCKLPYPVFSTLFMGTSAVWEVVKATTALCRVYGDLSVMSKMK